MPPTTTTMVMQAVSQAPVYLCLFDRDRRFLWANRYAFGYSAERLAGTRTEEDIHLDDRPTWVHQMGLCLELGESASGTCRLLASAQRLSYRMAAVRNGRGQIVGALVASWDTSLKSSPDTRDPRPFMFTPLGKAILAYLREHGPAKGAAIGRAVGQVSSNGQASSKVRWKLADLEDRGILRRTSEGYAISPEFAALGM